MDYNKSTVEDLKMLCKAMNIKGYSGKKKSEIIQLLVRGYIDTPSLHSEKPPQITRPVPTHKHNTRLRRLLRLENANLKK